MPSKKKKYNARFPAGRIKKIMQTDEEVGKVAQAVPVIISKALEMFIESLLKKSTEITQNRNAKTLTPSHMKQCILSESRFDFLKDLVKNVPDASVQEDDENNALAETNANFGVIPEELAEINTSLSDTREQTDNALHFIVPPANFYTEQLNNVATTSSTSTSGSGSSSTNKISITKHGQKERSHYRDSRKRNSLDICNSDNKNEEKNRRISRSTSLQQQRLLSVSSESVLEEEVVMPTDANPQNQNNPLVVPSQGGNGDSLCIDEDYDN